METMTTSAAVTINPADLEHLIGRVVKETVQEEFMRFFRTPNRPLLEYWIHEGPEDPEGDEQLLTEALAMIQQYGENREGWKTLEDFEAELAETANELPR
jgi:hypothetical protein